MRLRGRKGGGYYKKKKREGYLENLPVVHPKLSVMVDGWDPNEKVGGGGTVGAFLPGTARGTGAWLSGAKPSTHPNVK